MKNRDYLDLLEKIEYLEGKLQLQLRLIFLITVGSFCLLFLFLTLGFMVIEINSTQQQILDLIGGILNIQSKLMGVELA